MPDFCNQCAKDRNIPVPYTGGDLSDLVSRAQSEEGLFASALCEGCGLTKVDHKGECVSSTCTKVHGDY